ncbi:MAG: MarR family transcriptional regulator [Xenococcaceae cyanobacterium]
MKKTKIPGTIMTQARIEGKFYPLQHQEWLKACRELTPAQRDVLYYIRTIDPHNNGIEINAAEIARQLSSPERQVHRQTISRALDSLALKGWIDEKFSSTKQVLSFERKIRDRLHAQLGGLIEVVTPAGRIDLLTDTQIIEIKSIQDWKAALGQTLAYSGFYPEHQKRIHLFGSAFELKRLSDIEAACLCFGVKVTGEEV